MQYHFNWTPSTTPRNLRDLCCPLDQLFPLNSNRMQVAQRPTSGGLQCLASSHNHNQQHLRSSLRQQHGMTRHSSRRGLQPSKRTTLVKRRATQQKGAGGSSSPSSSSSKSIPNKRVQQGSSSSGNSPQQADNSSAYWWMQRLPG